MARRILGGVTLLVVASLLAMITPAVAAPPLVAATTDSVRATAEVLAESRAALDEAWDLAQAGNAAAAYRTSSIALARVDGALSGSLETPSRTELNKLRSDLLRVWDAMRKELGEPAPVEPMPATQGPAPSTPASETSAGASTRRPAVEPGNEADEAVLNAPAIEDVELQTNEDVFKWIEFFSGNGRSAFERWLKRSGRYVQLFRQVLQREGLPPDLVHLVFVESGFNLNARSVSAAVGPWQFLRSTGRLFGLTVNQWVDERKDPEKATVAAARYLKHLYSIFGDWPLALASYNAGEGTVLRAIKRQGTTNYWDLKLPRQTEDYVPQFMAVLAISREPEKYGFDAVELDDPMDFDTVALKGAVDLRAIARLAECSYDDLKTLNPAVLRQAAPGRDGVTTLRVPRGKGDVLLERLRDGDPLPAVNLTLTHRVRRGETIQAIARQYQVSATGLARDNGIGRKRPLRRGMTLTVRANLASRMPELADASDPRSSTAYVPSRTLRPPTSLEAESDAEGRRTVTLHRGETLSLIATRYGVSVDDIVRWNHLKTRHVRAGTRLKIRTGDAARADSAAADSVRLANAVIEAVTPGTRHRTEAPTTAGSHKLVVVRSGDTLTTIARDHGVTIADLRRANGLKGSRIRVGQRLRVPIG